LSWQACVTVREIQLIPLAGSESFQWSVSYRAERILLAVKISSNEKQRFSWVVNEIENCEFRKVAKHMS